MSQNKTLSATNNLSDIDGIASNISYQWMVNGTPVKDATSDKYLLTQDDVYKTISVSASYTDKLGKIENVLGGVVQNENDKPIGNVYINGTTRVDETLTVVKNIEDIDGMNGDFQYEWRANGEAFSEGDVLTLTKDLVGKAITVAVSYSDNGGTFETLVSDPTTKIIPQNTLPTGYLIAMGEAKVGSELAAFSTLSDVDGLGEFSYQWYNSDTPIKNATSDTYLLKLGDIGERISVSVQYVDSYGTLETVTSADTATIQPESVNGITLTDSNAIGTDKNDVLSAKPKVDSSISALAGNDVVSGNVGNDMLDGGKGDDKILGDKGNDKLIGGEGNDTLKGGLGADTMQGGDGNDYYFVDDAKDVIAESNKNGRLGGNDTVESTLTYTLDKNLENLVLAGEQKIDGTGNEFANQISGNLADNVLKGDAGNDDITGYKGADTLFGGEGEDVLDGGEGADVLNGDAGDDFLIGGEGSDILDGGAGSDVAIFNSSQADYQISRNTLADGSVEMLVKYIGNNINEGTDTLTNIEMLKFGDDEAINVSDVKDTVIPVISVTPDSINWTGTAADDTKVGTAGNDTLNGDAGKDTLDGGAGNDTITGGSFSDLLTGSAGADTFVYTNARDSAGTARPDTIVDFKTTVDKIDLFAIDAKSSTPIVSTNPLTNEAFTFIGNTTFTAGAAGEGQLRFNAANNTLEGNTDVNPATVEFSVVLTGVTAVSATDFVL
ncbi:MAG: calcium-binding protein [Methylococcaceae bacterium]